MSRAEITLINGNFLSMLAILFIALKLLGYIDWSWWWVLAPIWIPLSLVLLGLLLFVIIIWLRGDWF